MGSPSRLLATGYLAFAWIASAPAASDLVLNGSFEQTVHDFPAGWSRLDSAVAGATATSVIDVGVQGEKSVRIDRTGATVSAGSAGPGIAQHDLALKPGERYMLTFQARGSPASSSALRVWIQIPGASEFPPLLAESVPLTTDWTRHEFGFEFPEAAPAGRATLRFVVNSPATVWLDNIALSGAAAAKADISRPQPRLPASSSRNLVPNASFEAGADGWLSLGKPLGFGGNVAGLYGDIVGDDTREGALVYRLVLGPGHTPESYFDCWPPEHVVQNR
ncbi:MAG TPA: carbohydrate binding domain-containing protein, partial [Opitutus sp.]|nr:carbohydrate binding domain-containing protein [Opitutus sp.]